MNTLKKYSYDIVKLIMDQICIAMLGLVMTMVSSGNDKAYLITSILCVVFYVYILYVMMYETGKKDKPAIDGGRAKFNPLKGLWISLGANAVNIICGIMIAVFAAYTVLQSPVTVTDPAGNSAELFIRKETAETIDAQDYTYEPVTLYSNSGGEAVIGPKEGYKFSEVKNKGGDVASVYDKDHNEVELYSESGMNLSTTQRGVENWANNLYGVPFTIATFLQAMFQGIRYNYFDGNNYFYLLTPILPIFFSALGYIMGARGKRILFFLPERKQKPKY